MAEITSHAGRALLLVPLISLVALWPFLTRPLPATDDGMFHLLRLVELDRCLRHGTLLPRWAPDFAHGYGYPFFNFYASLSSYIAELWHLIGLDFAPAVAAATISAFLVSGWGACLLGRELGGWPAGLTAAAAYVYAPYQFYDSAYRGNLAEMWALALLPWVLWGGRRGVLGRRRDLVLGAVSCAALIYTHNVYAMIALPTLVVYLVVLWWKHGRRLRQGLHAVAVVLLGLGLSAFFWLPAFFEKGWTRISAALIDYTSFFLSPAELLSPPPMVDLSLLNFYPPRSLSWGMLTLIASGAIALAYRSLSARLGIGNLSLDAEWTFFALLFILSSLMCLPVSDPLWRELPLLRYVQIPWRYLGVASLAGSLLAGGAVAILEDEARSIAPASLREAGPTLLVGMAVSILVATAIPWTYAPPFPQPHEPGVADILRWEYATGLIGTTAHNEYMPIWAERLPSDPASPAMLHERDPIVPRLDESSLPPGAEVTAAYYTLMHSRFTIRTPVAFRARYRQLFFPGWQVTVDGQKVAPVVTAPYGLLGFDLPAGEHQIVIAPTTTPLRLAGELTSAVACLAILTLLLTRTHSPRELAASPPGKHLAGQSTSPENHRSPRPEHRVTLTWRRFIVLAALALSISALKIGLIDRTENPFRAYRFDGKRVPGRHREVNINFDLFTLYGYDLPSRPIPAGRPLRVDLYLGARREVKGNYLAYARLVDDEGRLWSRPDNDAPEGFRPPPPTSLWPGNSYAHWAYLVHVLPGTPPGEYWVQVGIFERDTWRGLNVLDDDGRIIALSTRLGPVRVIRPANPPPLDELGIKNPLRVPLGPDLECLGSTQEKRVLTAGEELPITLFWRARRRPRHNYALRLSLVNGERTSVLGDQLPLGRATHPTGVWVTGEVVRSPHSLQTPATVAAGDYRIAVMLLDEQGRSVASPLVVGEVKIEAVNRLMALPQGVQHRLSANLGDRVLLVGYDLSARRVARGRTLSVTLYWQAQREMRVSYKVFVQLVGPNGVLTQQDAIPVSWTRPTTGWLPGEVIVDSYTLVVPTNALPGRYELITGMYDERSLRRLAVSGGGATDDHVTLGEVAVE